MSIMVFLDVPKALPTEPYDERYVKHDCRSASQATCAHAVFVARDFAGASVALACVGNNDESVVTIRSRAGNMQRLHLPSNSDHSHSAWM